MSDECPRHVHQPLGDAGDAHQFAGQHKQGHSQQGKIVECLVKLLGQYQHRQLTIVEDGKDGRQPHAVANGQAQHHEDAE